MKRQTVPPKFGLTPEIEDEMIAPFVAALAPHGNLAPWILGGEDGDGPEAHTTKEGGGGAEQDELLSTIERALVARAFEAPDTDLVQGLLGDALGERKEERAFGREAGLRRELAGEERAARREERDADFGLRRELAAGDAAEKAKDRTHEAGLYERKQAAEGDPLRNAAIAQAVERGDYATAERLKAGKVTPADAAWQSAEDRDAIKRGISERGDEIFSRYEKEGQRGGPERLTDEFGALMDEVEKAYSGTQFGPQLRREAGEILNQKFYREPAADEDYRRRLARAVVKNKEKQFGAGQAGQTEEQVLEDIRRPWWSRVGEGLSRMR